MLKLIGPQTLIDNVVNYACANGRCVSKLADWIMEELKNGTKAGGQDLRRPTKTDTFCLLKCACYCCGVESQSCMLTDSFN